jgi:hypothetical protein
MRVARLDFPDLHDRCIEFAERLLPVNRSIQVRLTNQTVLSM